MSRWVVGETGQYDATPRAMARGADPPAQLCRARKGARTRQAPRGSWPPAWLCPRVLPSPFLQRLLGGRREGRGPSHVAALVTGFVTGSEPPPHPGAEVGGMLAHSHRPPPHAPEGMRPCSAPSGQERKKRGGLSWPLGPLSSGQHPEGEGAGGGRRSRGLCQRMLR